jgi:GDPmannose 4,6-dehydratase
MTVVQPHEVYHLGAQSHVGRSFELSFETLEANARGTLSVLEGARRLSDELRVRVYQASSSEMFGVPREYPQTEQTPFRPRNPYACSKVYGFHQAVCFRDAYQMFVCNGILYNHESPRRPAHYVTRKITRAAARIAAGLEKDVVLGSLEGGRDWGYAPEYVDAMWRMLQRPEPGDYVIATNQWHSLPQLLEAAFSQVNLNWQEHVRTDARLSRPAEAGRLQGDYSKAQAELGWKPQTDFAALIGLMVESDREQAALEATTEIKRA